MWPAKLIATCLGLGLVTPKGGGTLTSAIACLVWYVLQLQSVNVWIMFAGILSLFLIGVWSSSVVEVSWGKDHNRVVVDELMGMWVALFMLPLNWKYLFAAFLIFRFFDIVKPLYIRKAEQLNSGWGVMTDDLMAGLYTNLLLQLVAGFNLL